VINQLSSYKIMDFEKQDLKKEVESKKETNIENKKR